MKEKGKKINLLMNKEKVLSDDKNLKEENREKIKRINNVYTRKRNNSLLVNYYTNDFIENKNLLNNLIIPNKYLYDVLIKNKIKFNKMCNICFYYIIFSIIFFSDFIKCCPRKIKFLSSYIKMKKNRTGNINIFSSSFNTINYPNEVIINDITTHINDEVTYTYNFNDLENNINNIKLIWNNPIDSTVSMFKDCNKIIEIDLSNFNSSIVRTMENMFYFCSSLTSLDLTNFDTSNVIIMTNMFSGCSALSSLNLSSFNTSNVISMQSMFYSCSTLKFLNLSSFNTLKVTKMDWMFSCCSALNSLDLSSFNTSSVTTMQSMFVICTSLTSLDLSNFDT